MCVYLFVDVSVNYSFVLAPIVIKVLWNGQIGDGMIKGWGKVMSRSYLKTVLKVIQGHF